jgi:hypothetical protein
MHRTEHILMSKIKFEYGKTTYGRNCKFEYRKNRGIVSPLLRRAATKKK